MGTAQQNVDYCSKEDTRVLGPWSTGTMKLENKKESLSTQDLLKDVLSGKTTLQLALKYPDKWLRYNRALALLQQEATAVPRNWKTKVFWYWGTTGSGKSRLAHILTRYRAYIAVDNSGQWFDGYRGEKDVIFDDFSPDDLLGRGLFLRLFDRYPLRVAVKGGFVNWQPRRVFITSNYSPETLYSGDEAVFRRITDTIQF